MASWSSESQDLRALMIARWLLTDRAETVLRRAGYRFAGAPVQNLPAIRGRHLVGQLRVHQKAELNSGLDLTRRLSQAHRMTPGARPQSPAGGASKDNSSGPSASYFSNDCCIAS
jgi:hypothetical protein